jgi:hypothetical protein
MLSEAQLFLGVLGSIHRSPKCHQMVRAVLDIMEDKGLHS